MKRKERGERNELTALYVNRETGEKLACELFKAWLESLRLNKDRSKFM